MDEAFTQFVATRSADLMRVACALTGSRDAAADLTQSALEQAYRHWRRIETTEDPYAYVRRILVNKQRDGWRRLLRRPQHSVPEQTVFSDGMVHRVDSDDPSAQWARREQLRRLLGTLTARERAVIVLRFLEDRTEADTAAELGVALGTVKSTTARALGKLRVADQALQEIA